jgi:hypothetical protein
MNPVLSSNSLYSNSLSRDLQEGVPVQFREDLVQVVVILDDVVVEICKEASGDLPGRPGGNDVIEPSVVKNDGDLKELPTVAEIGMPEGRGEENEAPDAGFVSACEDHSHESPITRTDEDQIVLPGELPFEFCHPLLQGTRVILHEHIRISLPEETSLCSPTAAVETMNEYARDHFFHFVYPVSESGFQTGGHRPAKSAGELNLRGFS